MLNQVTHNLPHFFPFLSSPLALLPFPVGLSVFISFRFFLVESRGSHVRINAGRVPSLPPPSTSDILPFYNLRFSIRLKRVSITCRLLPCKYGSKQVLKRLRIICPCPRPCPRRVQEEQLSGVGNRDGTHFGFVIDSTTLEKG